MKKVYFLLLILPIFFKTKAQTVNCTFKKPAVTIHFGTGKVADVNKTVPYGYSRVFGSCPTDGHYTYTSYTSGCFSDDWFTIAEDHTPGDVDGNMMLVNAGNSTGPFLSTAINGLKSGTTYELAAWMMNLCKISDKCPFPLLPKITIQLETPDGKMIAQPGSWELIRRKTPEWTQYRALFTTPASNAPFILTMIDNSPSGCGNDFALDDITFRECVLQHPVAIAAPKATVGIAPRKTTVVVTRKPVVARKQPVKKLIQIPAKRVVQTDLIVKRQTDSAARITPVVVNKPPVFPPPPPEVTTRANPLIKKLETEAGVIRLDLYDNGEIDGDTISIYHNNVLTIAHARLSEKPITFTIVVDPLHPHHELIMVADNLGSIPPNTSLMVVTAGTKRYEVFISSNEQKNAKVILDLKK